MLRRREERKVYKQKLSHFLRRESRGEFEKGFACNDGGIAAGMHRPTCARR